MTGAAPDTAVQRRVDMNTKQPKLWGTAEEWVFSMSISSHRLLNKVSDSCERMQCVPLLWLKYMLEQNSETDIYLEQKLKICFLVFLNEAP